MGLSAKESKLLENLLKKKDQPDAPPTGKSLNISIDLGDDKQVERAQKLGLFDGIFGDDDDDDDGDDGDDGDGDEEVPRRRGYFNKEGGS